MDRKLNLFDKVIDLYLSSEIKSLKRYEIRDFIVYEFSRDELGKVIDFKAIENLPSIYILQETENNEIYIGETESFLTRVKDHSNTKEFDKIYVISSAVLNKNICLSIEEKTINLFKNSVVNYDVKNKNLINNSLLSKRDNLRANEDWKFFKEIYSLLRFNLSPKNKNDEEDDLQKGEEFSYKKGKLKIVEGGFLLLEGSQIFMGEPKEYVKNKLLKIRDSLIDKKIINDLGTLQENIFWKFPSYFSDILSGGSTSGYDEFKTKKGITLGDYLGREPQQRKSKNSIN